MSTVNQELNKSYIQVLDKCEHIKLTVRNFVSNFKYLFCKLSATLKTLQQQFQISLQRNEKKERIKLLTFWKLRKWCIINGLELRFWQIPFVISSGLPTFVADILQFFSFSQGDRIDFEMYHDIDLQCNCLQLMKVVNNAIYATLIMKLFNLCTWHHSLLSIIEIQEHKERHNVKDNFLPWTIVFSSY